MKAKLKQLKIMTSKKFTISKLNTLYKTLDKAKICQFVCGIFSNFENRLTTIEDQVAKKDVFLSALGILNSFDHYAQFYKGVVPNKDEKVECDKNKQNCTICLSGISYKCRTRGSRKKKNNWHYSKDNKWEMATVTEGYKNFLKNTGVASDKQMAIYKLRNEIDHQGFWSDNITVQSNQLFFYGDDLLDMLRKSLNNFKIELYKELENQNFRVDKSSRVVRFLDHLFYIKPDQFKTNNKK